MPEPRSPSCPHVRPRRAPSHRAKGAHRMNQDSPVAADNAATTSADRHRSDDAPRSTGSSEGGEGAAAPSSDGAGTSTGTGAPRRRRSRGGRGRSRSGSGTGGRRGRHQDPGRPFGRRSGTCRRDGRRRIHAGSSSPARTCASHDHQGRHDRQGRHDPRAGRPPRPARPPGLERRRRRSRIARGTGIGGWRIRVAHRCSEAASPSRRPRTRRWRRWRPRGHHGLAVERSGSRE